MKRLLLITLLAASMAHAGWWKTYGGTDSDRGHCIQLTTDGNYIIAGATWSFGNNNTWLIKVDTLGDTFWSHSYSGGMAWYHWVEETKDNGFITDALLRVDSVGDSLWAYDYGIRSFCVLHSTLKCNTVVCDFEGCFEIQALSGPVV